ncbi:tyrosine recombinase XerC [Leeia aquatica]|uniref:Tyrosine recombinase XerC n=1 Tax=Leeia aquatica TaxID=2725557 RepID=A0A847S968_9NEIS|nr:tyrosine recombinase XerC [Leeia aquatica]NLR76534.1 tyrosine recombinase XerC [Leeia aquatica]
MSTSPDLAELQPFLGWMAQARQASPHTLTAYQRDLRVLQDAGWPLQEASPLQIRRLLADRARQGLSARSLARMLSAWRRFYQYQVLHQGWSSNPCLGVRPPRRQRALPEVLTPDRASQLLQPLAEATDDPLLQRDQAVYELLYSSGLRVSELVALDLQDWRADEQELHVRFAKGRKSRVVPVGKPATLALQQWLQVRHAQAGEVALFTSARGQRLGVRSIQQRLRQHGIQQGVPQGVYPHLLRHSCASHVLQSSGDLRAVQELLGHASISSTQVYTHLDFQRLAAVYDAAHPRAKRKPE